MSLDYLINLTLSIYRMTDGFKDEFLKIKFRTLTSEILKSFVLTFAQNPVSIEKGELQQLVSDFNKVLETARRKKVINRDEFIFIKQEYSKLEKKKNKPKGPKGGEEALKKNQLAPEPKTKKTPIVRNGLKHRQKKLLEILEKAGQAQVNELKNFFPDISKRTLRRDIDVLLKKGLILRKGQWNDVFYTLAKG